MNNSLNLNSWQSNVYIRWTVLPVLAHILSWMTGWMGIVLFPALVTVAQYLVFKSHPDIARPGFWFVTLPVTFFVWIKWGPYGSDLKSDSILHGVMAYYAGQLINVLFIPLIIRKERPDFLLNWIMCTLIAGMVWVGLYRLVLAGWLGGKFSPAGGVAMFILYPAIALIANGVSGFFLKSKLIINDERY